MLPRREMKQRARQSVKRHYGVFLVVCLLAAFFGTEFGGSLDAVKQYDEEKTVIVQDGNLSFGITTGAYSMLLTDGVVNALNGNIQKGEELSSEETRKAVERTKNGEGNPVFGRSKGVLAKGVNGILSGSILVTLIGAIKRIGASSSMIWGMFIILAFLFYFVFWLFLINMFQAVSRRMFLEGRIYEKVPVQRFLVFLRVRKWMKVSFTMFMKTLFETLWDFTIIGGIIKKYSYYMVPYIVAENPDIEWKKAITLSRKMMNGHKWECFVFELSFFLWDALALLTEGIVVFYFFFCGMGLGSQPSSNRRRKICKSRCTPWPMASYLWNRCYYDAYTFE